MTMHRAFVAILVLASACAVDEPRSTDEATVVVDEPDEGPAETQRRLPLTDEELSTLGLAQQTQAACVFVYPGQWGCRGDNWCNDYCRYRGDSQYGFWYSCVKKPSHWETVCICCG